MGDIGEAFQLDGQRPLGGSEKRRFNWNLLMAVLTITGWLLMAASGVFGDYRQIGDRVTRLEEQRMNDTQRLNRIEDKIDRLLEQRVGR